MANRLLTFAFFGPEIVTVSPARVPGSVLALAAVIGSVMPAAAMDKLELTNATFLKLTSEHVLSLLFALMGTMRGPENSPPI